MFYAFSVLKTGEESAVTPYYWKGYVNGRMGQKFVFYLMYGDAIKQTVTTKTIYMLSTL